VVGSGETLSSGKQRLSFLRRSLIAALLLFGTVAASAWILGSVLVHPANHTCRGSGGCLSTDNAGSRESGQDSGRPDGSNSCAAAPHANGTATAHLGFRSRAIKSINHLGAPVLIAAGSDDEHTTLSESEELYVAAANPKELWIRLSPTP
jgi:hypothetical protein